MSKEKIWSIVGGLLIGLSAAMYVIGGESGHLTELRDFFFAPLPFAAIAFGISTKLGKQNSD